MDNGYKYFLKNHQKIFIMPCVKFDEWMKNDVKMTLWL